MKTSYRPVPGFRCENVPASSKRLFLQRFLWKLVPWRWRASAKHRPQLFRANRKIYATELDLDVNVRFDRLPERGNCRFSNIIANDSTDKIRAHHPFALSSRINLRCDFVLGKLYIYEKQVYRAARVPLRLVGAALFNPDQFTLKMNLLPRSPSSIRVRRIRAAKSIHTNVTDRHISICARHISVHSKKYLTRAYTSFST